MDWMTLHPPAFMTKVFNDEELKKRKKHAVIDGDQQWRRDFCWKICDYSNTKEF